MIPADVASRLQVSADTTLRPVAPSQEISDKLSGLVAGQKVMAEIQSLLPNGTYRAMINQRNITLALPFSAKSGDTLELQVTESNGKLALAIVTGQEGEGGKPLAESASATLSRTAQMISTLFSGAREAKGNTQSLPLNGNQPVTHALPQNAQDLVPLLKQAITQSGMFYESHQAEWLEGRFAKTQLLQEPQGKLSQPSAFSTAEGEQAATTTPKTPAADGGRVAITAQDAKTLTSNPATATETRSAADLPSTQTAGTDASKASSTSQPTQQSSQMVAPQVQHMVQQQLEALATQNFSWQGQIWPGQEMRWEIDENAGRPDQADEETAKKWTTRLRMTLPVLGEVDAQIRLQGNQVALTLSAADTNTRELMRTSSLALRTQLDEAGLTLASIGIDTLTENTDDAQA